MKRLASLLLLAMFALPAHSLDWGVNVNEVPLAILGATTLYVDSLKANAWASQPIFGADLKLQGEASFSASSSGGAWKWADPTYDLTEASLKGVTPLGGGSAGLAEWDLGRRNVTDLSGGWVLGSRWDGAGVNWLKGSSALSISAGYSGLLSKKTSKIAASEADIDDNSNPRVLSAPQRVYTLVGWGVDELFLRQDVRTELLGHLDLRSDKDSVHGVYSTLLVTGPLPLGLRHKLSGTGAVRITPTKLTYGLLGGGEVSATLPFLGSRVVISGAASDGLGGHGFQPVSGKGMAEVISLSSAHGAVVGGDFSFKPLAKTTLGLKGSALFRTSRDILVLPGFDTASHDLWIGTEAGIYGSWTPTSETSFGLNGGLFLPQSGAFVASTAPTILAVVTATLKL